MKSERHKSRLTMLMVALAAISLAACAMEMDGDEELSSEEIELLVEEEGAEAAVAPDTTAEEGPIEINDGSCSTSIDSGGHRAVGRCSGYLNTGTFRVTTLCCLTSCSGRIGGGWAFLSGGTSTAGCGSAFASSVQIHMGPAGG